MRGMLPRIFLCYFLLYLQQKYRKVSSILYSWRNEHDVVRKNI